MEERPFRAALQNERKKLIPLCLRPLPESVAGRQPQSPQTSMFSVPAQYLSTRRSACVKNTKAAFAGGLRVRLLARAFSYGASEITPNVPDRLLFGPAVKNN